MAFQNKDMNLEGGDVYLATNYDFSTDTITDVLEDWSNNNTVASEIEATYSFENVGYLQDISFYHSLEEEKSVKSDNCGKWEIYASATLTPRAEWTRLEVDNIDAIARMTGLTVQNVAGVLVPGATQTETNPSAYLKFIPIANQNCDGSAVVINSVTGSIDGLLVVGTDYNIVTNANNEYGIELVSGGAITTLTQDFVINYDYTPCQSQYLGYEVKAREIPYMLIKVVSCPNANGERNTYYLKKAKMNAEIQQALTNLDRNDLAGASMSFTGVTGSTWIENKWKVS